MQANATPHVESVNFFTLFNNVALVALFILKEKVLEVLIPIKKIR